MLEYDSNSEEDPFIDLSGEELNGIREESYIMVSMLIWSKQVY